MAAIRIYGRQVEISGTGITLALFDFSPLPEAGTSETKLSHEGSSPVLGKPYVVDVEIPGDQQVEDVGMGRKAILDENGSPMSALDVMIRVAKGVDGYRVTKVSEMS